MRFRCGLAAALLCTGMLLAGAAGKARAEAKPKFAGTIRVQGKHTKSELKQMAKITAEEATRTAVAAAPGNAADKKVEDTELAVENGYLIYCVDVQVKGKGDYEVIIDAGNGKVLAQTLEEDDDD